MEIKITQEKVCTEVINYYLVVLLISFISFNTYAQSVNNTDFESENDIKSKAWIYYKYFMEEKFSVRSGFGLAFRQQAADYDNNNLFEFWFVIPDDRKKPVVVAYPLKKTFSQQFYDLVSSNPSIKPYEIVQKLKYVDKLIYPVECPNMVPVIESIDNSIFKEVRPLTWKNTFGKYEYMASYYENGIRKGFYSRYPDYKPLEKLLKVKKVLADCAKFTPTNKERKIIILKEIISRYRASINVDDYSNLSRKEFIDLVAARSGINSYTIENNRKEYYEEREALNLSMSRYLLIKAYEGWEGLCSNTSSIDKIRKEIDDMNKINKLYLAFVDYYYDKGIDINDEMLKSRDGIVTKDVMLQRISGVIQHFRDQYSSSGQNKLTDVCQRAAYSTFLSKETNPLDNWTRELGKLESLTDGVREH